jgi:hypothetical protein
VVREMMASEACRHTVYGVAPPDRFGGKPFSRLAELVTNGRRRLSRQKLYQILKTEMETTLVLVSSRERSVGKSSRFLLGKKDVRPANVCVKRRPISGLTVIGKALGECSVEIIGRHDGGVIVRREGVGGLCDFKDESGKRRAVLQLGKELNLQ